MKKVGVASSAPMRGSDGAAGYDLRSAESAVIHPGEQRIVPTGYAWAIPDGHVGLIRDRSGMAAKRRLTTRAGVIDSDYRGEVKIVVVNEGIIPVTISAGERIAQMVIVPCVTGDIEIVDDLDDTSRGDGGFGSTGEE